MQAGKQLLRKPAPHPRSNNARHQPTMNLNISTSNNGRSGNPASPTFTAPPVIRSYALSVDAFDHLKAMQRVYERQTGERLTNSQALERVLRDHERAAHGAA